MPSASRNLNERRELGKRDGAVNGGHWSLKSPSALGVSGKSNPDLPQLSSIIIMFERPRSQCVLPARSVVVLSLPDRKFVGQVGDRA